MNIQVDRFEAVHVKGKKFVGYITSVEHLASGSKWEIPIRYSVYNAFHAKLVKTDPKAAKLPFPKKSLFAPPNATRRDLLNKFVTQLTTITLSPEGSKLLDALLDLPFKWKLQWQQHCQLNQARPHRCLWPNPS
ncbi:hypothetical protein H257_15576 [Aphanomyces astaci]|uniref:PX domain-containing protein n=1 Tax=Aphanomyces astaci TaxID=112090 RepID=W4FLP5_APHAT|nr:hypothetical protein H257_15576 [Aphanomyces astaci]ETV68405.1 hypothetical protein H257_15576 [Aphanomyces astaci]|eukprot:XP_009842031.1 hypothetical protein H257_15576 [Aphanomyces astaci]